MLGGAVTGMHDLIDIGHSLYAWFNNAWHFMFVLCSATVMGVGYIMYSDWLDRRFKALEDALAAEREARMKAVEGAYQAAYQARQKEAP